MKTERIDMKKLLVAACAAAAMAAIAEENKDAPEAETESAPIVWGFGNYGLYSGYCLYGSLVNSEPVAQGYAELNFNIPANLGYLGLGVWSNCDLTPRRGRGNRVFINSPTDGKNLVGGFNEWDFNVHWGKTFWFNDDQTWGLDYRTWFVWYWYPPHDGYGHTHTTWDWDHSFALLNPYVTPYITWVREYSKGANLLEFGLRRPTEIDAVEGLTLTPSINFVWREQQYNWCFPTGFGGCSNCNSGIATLRIQLDATYQLTEHFGLFAKIAYCSIIDPDLRRNIDDELDPAAYGATKDFAWGGIGVTFNF